MVEKIILHIGTEKTGSTSIQHALAHDRASLARHGVLFPALFGSENHMEIAVYAMDDGVNDELRQSELGKAGCALPDYRRRLIEQIEQQIAASGCHTLIISNEHCHSRLVSPTAIARLKDLLARFAPKVEVIAYLRRQDRLAVSLHSTRVKLGGQGQVFPSLPHGRLNEYFRFDTLLQRYADAFGAENITARLFESGQLAQGDVVADFYLQTRLPIPAPDLPNANESLSAKQGLFLERFNAIFPLIVHGKVNPMRGPVFSVIANTCTGAPFRPARAEAQSFYAPFREGNAAVREAYFGSLDRPTLFDESFDSYPESATDITLTTDEMFEFVTAIWKHARALAQRNR